MKRLLFLLIAALLIGCAHEAATSCQYTVAVYYSETTVDTLIIKGENCHVEGTRRGNHVVCGTGISIYQAVEPTTAPMRVIKIDSIK